MHKMTQALTLCEKQTSKKLINQRMENIFVVESHQEQNKSVNIFEHSG